MKRLGIFGAFLTIFVACAAPSPTTTPTQLAAAAATPTKAPTATPTKRPLIKTTLTQSAENMDYLAVAAAERLGYFRDEGQDLERVVTGKGDVANAAVIGGSAQFVASTASEPINAAAQGDKKLVIVQALVTELTNNVIIRKEVADRLGITEKSPLETRLKALKGLRIGIVSTGGFGNTLIRYTLRMANLDPEREVEITAVGDAGAHVAALRQGTIDVMLRAPPANSIPVAEGWAVTLVNYQAGEVKELSGILFQTVNMSRDYAEAHPEIALPAARAVFKGIQLIQQKENDAKAVARQLFPDLDPKVFEEVWRAGYPSFSKDGIPTKEGTKKHIDVISTFAEQPLKVIPEDVLLPRYAEQAKRELADWRP